MKQRKRWLGLASAPFALAFLAFALPAHAQSGPYIGNCAGLPNHVTGDAIVSDTTCVIDVGGTLVVDGTLTVDADSVDVKSEIQSMGKVTIRTNGGGELKLRKKASSQNNDILLQSPQNRIETKGLEAGNSVQVDAGLLGAEGATWDIKVDGTIIVNKIQSNQNPDVHANILLRAAGAINTKTIRTDGGLGVANSIKSGGVQIEAYRNGGTAPNGAEFVIGGTGAANGVNGDIITGSTIGGGTSPTFVNGGLYVTMGGPTSTGAIRVADMSAIKVRASQSRSGFIIFNANAGTIYLPEGNLNSSGDTTNNTGAGLIFLMAKTLDTQPGTVISVNQTETAAGTGHQIFIAVETLKYRGNGTDGLKILSDGNGGGGFFSIVNISPFGYLVPGMLTSNVNQMPWTFTLSSAELAKDGPLTIDGTEGNAQLLLRSDGNTAAVNVSGYPLAFNGGDVTVRSRGQTLHRINVGFFGTVNGARQGLTVNNVGNWTLDANGQAPASGGAAAGGIIQVKADQSSLTALDSPTDPSSGNIVIRANGADENGDGGIISIDTKSFVLGDTTRAVVNANGAPNGTGNAINSPLDSAGPFAVTFKSGSTNMIFGGGNKAVKITATGGKTSGNGGTIKVLPGTGTITVRNSLALDASAIGNNCGASCDAGQIQVVASGEIKANTSATGPVVAAIKANGAGSGTGGKIILQSTGDVVTEGSIEANGGCEGGDGGEITLTGENVKTLGESSASGGDGSFCLAVAGPPNSFAARLAPGSANGGKKTINANDKWLNGQMTALHFDGKGDGNGGEITINNPNQPVDLSPLPDGFISAKAGPDGKGIGGKVTIANAKGTQAGIIDVNRIIKVDGGSDIDAENQSFGKISLNGVTCEQWKTGFQNNAGDAFPQTVWNCVDGQRATVMSVAAAANTFEVGPRRLLTNEPRHHIYVMPIINTYQTFFARPQNNRKGTYGITPDQIPVSVAFQNVYDKNGVSTDSIGYSGSNTIWAATIVHESGHKLDQRWGSPSATPAFSNLRPLDYQYMNVDPATGNPRPCADVFDASSNFCTKQSNLGLTNTQIFEKEYPGLKTDYNELFAVLLEHVKSTQPNSGYSADPWLEAPLRFFPNMSAFIQGQLNQP